MYYNRQTQIYYENDEQILRKLIFSHSFYKTGFSHYSIKEKIIEAFPTIICKQKVFTIYQGGKKYQETVIEISKKPPQKQFYTVEKWLEQFMNEPNSLTEYGKKVYAQVLNHFQNHQTVQQLKNNLFIFQDNT